MKNPIYTVLIVDDSEINRKILFRILNDEYNVLQAENGKQALDIMINSHEKISAVLLDLIMPVMDGYSFLYQLKNTLKHGVPVIVTTGNNGKENEKQAFNLGACDFISKPYDAQILKYRLQSAISRSESAALEKMKHMSEHDALTGLYNRNKFFAETRTMLNDHPESNFAFVRFDVDRFALINTFFGNAEGDRLLKFIAEHIEIFSKKYFENITYGRIEADEFAFCCTFEDLIILKDLLKKFTLYLKNYSLSFEIILTFGVYIVTNREISPRQMLDNANLAAKKVKGHYSNNISFYDDEMGKMLIADQEIINDMNQALEEKQFCIYVQPKYDLHTNLPAGAEVLVRWMHPKKGMIAPNEFIPIFERNGFVAKLDYYVWEQACCLLEEIKKSGLPLLPISVNVSRVHLYNPHLTDLICNIADKHNVPHKLLNLELTESIYTEHLSVIQENIESLHKNGFLVMMDDFGSGYSSLNVLKDVEFDVLKIDMRFFEDSSITGRKEKIIASIIRMAKWLGIPTIAEGVETRQQVNFLNDMGCEYVQGYYFAKPMPTDEYKKLLSNDVKPSKNKDDDFHVNKIWKNNDQIELMFAISAHPLALFEFNDNKLEIIRVNNKYYEIFGYDNFSYNSINFDGVLSKKQKEILLSAVNDVVENKDVSECDYIRKVEDGTKRYIQIYLRYITQIGSRHIILGTFFDITDEVKIKEKLNFYKVKIKQLEHERNCSLELSKKDSLTKLYNRTAIEDYINRHLCSQPDLTHGFLMMDLDNFKTINDTYGHICGDEVLKEVTDIFCSFFRNTDIVGRLGGDEFVVFMPNVQNEQNLLNKANEICDVLTKHKLTNKRVQISITIGACISNKESSFLDLYSKADKALYEAKKAGKTQAKLYQNNKQEVCS